MNICQVHFGKGWLNGIRLTVRAEAALYPVVNLGGNMDFSLHKSKMKQCNSKFFCFAFVVYWRHYG